MTHTAPTGWSFDSWLGGAPCPSHGSEWCAACKPSQGPQPSTRGATPVAPSTAPRERNPGRRSAPTTPHPYWDSLERRTPPERKPAATGPRWTIDRDLRAWQHRAIAAWEDNGCRGVVEAATGTGKTMVALAAAATLRERYGSTLRVAVVVPTQALAGQWHRAFVQDLAVEPWTVCEEHSAASRQPGPSDQVIVSVINSARSRLPDRVERWEQRGQPVLVVVDECHRAGSDHNSSVVRTNASFTLGLSATPERTDRGHEREVYPGIGDPIYRYPLLTALDDGVLAPLVSVNLYVDLTAKEQVEWDELGRELAKALARLESEHPGISGSSTLWTRMRHLAQQGDRVARRVVALATERRRLLTRSTERRRCAQAALEWLAEGDERAMVFHEGIADAEALHSTLSRLGATPVLDHSQLPRDTRDQNLARFRNDTARQLVAVRSLDEGIDVPDAAIAVIAAGSRSPRQRIQRLGRILRAAPDKQAIAVSILVRGTPEESDVGGRDAVLLGSGRVVHHRWPGRSIATAVDDRRSSYQPRGLGRVDAVEMLTRAELGLLGARTERVVQPRAERGGYTAKATAYAVNAWHPVAEVRVSSGMPAEEFDRHWPSVRLAFRLRLDPRFVEDASLIHGSEIEAVIRSWRKHRRRG